MGIPTKRGSNYSPWQPLGIPSAITPIAQLHQSPPSPIPGDLGRGPSHQSTCSTIDTRMGRLFFMFLAIFFRIPADFDFSWGNLEPFWRSKTGQTPHQALPGVPTRQINTFIMRALINFSKLLFFRAFTAFFRVCVSNPRGSWYVILPYPTEESWNWNAWSRWLSTRSVWASTGTTAARHLGIRGARAIFFFGWLHDIFTIYFDFWRTHAKYMNTYSLTSWHKLSVIIHWHDETFGTHTLKLTYPCAARRPTACCGLKFRGQHFPERETSGS